MSYMLRVVLFGLLWLAVGSSYGAGMGLALGWGSYTLIPVLIATVYTGAAYIHFWRSQRYMWADWELLFSLLPWYLMLSSVASFAILGIKSTTVNGGWCALYALTALALLIATGCEAFKSSLVLSFIPKRAKKEVPKQQATAPTL